MARDPNCNKLDEDDGNEEDGKDKKDDESGEDEEDEDDEEVIELKSKRVAQEEAKEHDVNRFFQIHGLKPFPECIVSREQWGAVSPQSEGLPLDQPVDNVVFTYKTGVDRCEEEEECERAIRGLQQKHLTEGGMADIGFNFIVGGDSRVYEGRGWHHQPDPDFQFPELKGRRLDIGFIGDFCPAETELPYDMAGMALELAHYGVEQGYLAREYRLVETEMHLSPDQYEAGKEEVRPDLQLRFEKYWPGQVIKEQLAWENPEDQVPPEECEDEEE